MWYAVGFRPASGKRTPLPCTVHHRHRRRCDRHKVQQKDHLAVKNVFCRHQGTAIMPRIKTAFECMILFSFTFTFEIRYYKYWSGSTYHTFEQDRMLVSAKYTPLPDLGAPPPPPPPVKKSYLRPWFSVLLS